MSRTYYNLTELVDAASAHDFAAHLHIDDQGKPVFSVGNSNTGAHEFPSYAEVMGYLEKCSKGVSGLEQGPAGKGV